MIENQAQILENEALWPVSLSSLRLEATDKLCDDAIAFKWQMTNTQSGALKEDIGSVGLQIERLQKLTAKLQSGLIED